MRFGFRASKKLACNAFSRAGACGRGPSEPADPGASASWVLLKKWWRVGSRKRLYRGRGLGLASGPQDAHFGFRKGVVLPWENEGFRSRDDSGSGRVSDRVPGRLPEVLRRAFGTSGVVEK